MGHGFCCLLGDRVLRPLREAANAEMAAKVGAMIRVLRREPTKCWTPEHRLVTLETGSIGFAGAADDDRRRWVNGFRRLIDGLDSPLQTVINVEPGPGDDPETFGFEPADLEPGWLFRLLPPGLAIRLSWHCAPLPAAWVVHYLQRQLINMRATHLIDSTAGSSDPTLAGALPNAEDLQRRLASSQYKAFHVSVYLTLTSPTSVALEEGSRRIEAAARAILCELQPCTLRMRDGFLATQAGGPDRLQRKRVIDSSALVTFFPWSDPDLQEPGGLFVGRSSATGSPVLIDPFDQGRYTNANVAVFGHSGAGKTYLLSTLVMGALGSGAHVYIIDPEHEYGGIARQLGGIDVPLALGSGHALNVLDLRPSGRHDEAWLGPAAADAVDLCACVCGNLDESERAQVEGAVRLAYEETQQPVLRDVADRLPRGSRVAVILQRWVRGSLGQMFSAPTNVDLEAPIVVF